jgi:hypothetical protein
MTKRHLSTPTPHWTWPPGSLSLCLQILVLVSVFSEVGAMDSLCRPMVLSEGCHSDL